MKKYAVIFSFFLIFSLLFQTTFSQCAMCTKTAQQLGEKPAIGLNNGILYLMLAPFIIVGFIGFRWWKNNKQIEADEQKKV
ncbi:MAG: hypothetical protein QM737_10475 [Ferruginibacter sp.]